MRPVLLRSLAVLGGGLLVLAGILYYASTVDSRPPLVERIALTQHQSGDEHLALTTSAVEVQFSEAVQADSAEAAFRLEPPVDGEYSWSGTIMTFTPVQRLPLETGFRAVVEAGVLDEAGNEMAEPSAAFEFTTVGPPAVVVTDPQDRATGVALDAPIVIEFSSLMDTASVEDALDVQPRVGLEVTWSAQRLTLTPTDQFDEATRYRVSIGSDARDSSGIPLVAPYRFSFVTARSPLGVALLVPADGTSGVAVTTPIAIFMDRELDPDSVSSDMFGIEPDVAGSLEVVAPPGAAGLADPGRRIVRFVPSAPLAPSTTYRVTLEAGAAATDGALLPEPLEWTFTTGTPLASLSNQMVFLSDRAGIANLWAMNPDGSAQRQLSAELSPVVDYAVSPNGRSFIVADGAVLVLQDANGGSRNMLTPAGALEYDPAWSPNGSRFAFGRSDLESGEGLGIWSRAADGGDATRLELPIEIGGDPLPSPVEEGSGQRLRVPRYSPDGGALAFVDLSGRIAVVELPAQRLSTAAYVGVGPPVWLRDSSGVLVAGVDGAPIASPPAGRPVPAFDPVALGLPESRLASLRIARQFRGGQSVDHLDLQAGAFGPAVSRSQLLYLLLGGGDEIAAGTLHLSNEPVPATPGRRLLGDEEAVRSAAFGIEPDTIVAALADDGIWLVDASTGDGEQLSPDGWLPRWLP